MANDQAADCHRSWPVVTLDRGRCGSSGSDGGTDRLLTTLEVQELGQFCWHGRQPGHTARQWADLRVTDTEHSQRTRSPLTTTVRSQNSWRLIMR